MLKSLHCDIRLDRSRHASLFLLSFHVHFPRLFAHVCCIYACVQKHGPSAKWTSPTSQQPRQHKRHSGDGADADADANGNTHSKKIRSGGHVSPDNRRPPSNFNNNSNNNNARSHHATAPSGIGLKGYDLPDIKEPSPPPPPPKHHNNSSATATTNANGVQTTAVAPIQGEHRKYNTNTFPASHRKIGQIRRQTMIEGTREATPDQDDIRDIVDDDEDGGTGGGGDILAATIATVLARDRVLDEELREQNQLNHHQDYYHSSSSSDDEEEAEKGKKKRTKALPTPRTATTTSSGDGKEEEAVVDFEYDGTAYPEIREKQKKKKARWEHVGGAAPTAIKAGTLTHAGAVIDPSTRTTVIPSSQQQQEKQEDSFTALGVAPPLAAHLASLHFLHPTPTQQASIPVLLSKRDSLIKAPTGSGKTLSYVVPIIQDLASQTEPRRVGRGDGTLALILCPTRELCLQVVDVCTLVGRRYVWVVPGTVHGGENRGKEKARLRKGVNVLVTTPGRLLDHLRNTEAFKIDGLRWVVLDEADRLLDLGFEKKIAEILKCIDEKVQVQHAHDAGEGEGHKRTSVLLSATLHRGLHALAGLSLHNPVSIGWDDDGTDEEKGKDVGGSSSIKTKHKNLLGEIPDQLQQHYIQVPCKLRLVVLAAMLKLKMSSTKRAKLVVFFSNCDSVDFHHAVFVNGGHGNTAWAAAAGSDLFPAPTHHASTQNKPKIQLVKLHGNMSQADRTASLLAYTKAESAVLFCTDVAARGLDFPAVSCILQFDPPGTAEEYIHRVGRTARLGSSGEAVLFIQPSEKGYVQYLIDTLGVQRLHEVPAAVVLDRTLGVDVKAGKTLPIERHQGAFRLQKELMEHVCGEGELRGLGERAFTSYVRAYATHASELKPFFNVKILHLGHVAHSFALKEKPTDLHAGGHQHHQKKNFTFGGGGGGLGGRKHDTHKRKKESSGLGRYSYKSVDGYVLD